MNFLSLNIDMIKVICEIPPINTLHSLQLTCHSIHDLAAPRMMERKKYNELHFSKWSVSISNENHLFCNKIIDDEDVVVDESTKNIAEENMHIIAICDRVDVWQQLENNIRDIDYVVICQSTKILSKFNNISFASLCAIILSNNMIDINKYVLMSNSEYYIYSTSPYHLQQNRWSEVVSTVAFVNNLELLKQICKKRSTRLVGNYAYLAAYGAHYQCLDLLYSYDILRPNNLVITSNNDYNKPRKYDFLNNNLPQETYASVGVFLGNVNLLKYFAKRGDTSFIDVYFPDKNIPWSTNNICASFISGNINLRRTIDGILECYEYMWQCGGRPRKWSYLPPYRHPRIIKWLLSRGAIPDKHFISKCVESANLELLELLHSFNVKILGKIFRYSVMNNKKDLHDWAFARGILSRKCGSESLSAKPPCVFKLAHLGETLPEWAQKLYF